MLVKRFSYKVSNQVIENTSMKDEAVREAKDMDYEDYDEEG